MADYICPRCGFPGEKTKGKNYCKLCRSDENHKYRQRKKMKQDNKIFSFMYQPWIVH